MRSPCNSFWWNPPWSVRALRQRRIELIFSLLGGRKLVLVIDETGDRKKGHTTDYVKRQYIGNLGKVENGIVSVDAYGMIDNIAFPLTFSEVPLLPRSKNFPLPRVIEERYIKISNPIKQP